MTNPSNRSILDRRTFLAACSMAGISHPAFLEALWRRRGGTGGDGEGLGGPGGDGVGQEAQGKVTREMVMAAEQIIGLEFTDAERDMMLTDLNNALRSYDAIHGVSLPNGVFPAIRFDPVTPGLKTLPDKGIALRVTDERRRRRGDVTRPATDAELAFLPLAQLADLVRSRKVTATELTRLYLDRLKRYDPQLLCVINLTEARALDQARKADQEIASGHYRGPLHGIPWGAKDLFAVPGYPTTWGSPIYRNQMLSDTATVVQKLDDAGAILVAKLTLGEFAMGDVWYGGMTRNPWKLDQGSSGSSAGPASATVAGLVGFAIGTETLGSIVSPSTRCGASGLRPTFGRVSRHGAMALSWTMDKVGPICRTAEDCGLVFEAIHGADGLDPTAVDEPFRWSPAKKLEGLRVGYLKSAFEADHPTKAFDDAVLDVLRRIGVNLVPISFDQDVTVPTSALRIILTAEAGAAFDELTRTNQDDQMVRQQRGAWPNTFRASRFIPAVEYINANRIRTLLMRQVDQVMQQVDVFVTPSFGGNVLLTTNLTGHPTLAVPNGYREDDGTPVSISFVGRLYGEADVLAVGKAYQDATDFHRKHPGEFV
jgi:Asp-tRNA(Asn)/Glu-tRNA(Gln) amidotransferase A subunit family amidase